MTARAAAQTKGGSLCGHCARLLAPRPSEVMFEAVDGSLTVYEDRLRYKLQSEKAVVLSLRPPLQFSCTGGIVFSHGLKISNGAVRLKPMFGSREERDVAADQLRVGGVEEP